MEEIVFRHELKYEITYSDYLAIRSRLRNIATLDAHVGPTGTYKIRSLYFDNYTDKALREKLDGLNVREKFRIRYYNDDTSRITLEKKSKVHGMCRKEQARITKEECEAMFVGQWEVLQRHSNPLIQELYQKIKIQQMKPRVIVDYIREPYIYELGNVRVTFDSQIKTGLYSMDFLNPDVPMIDAGTERTMILEVKYDEYLPEIIQMAIQFATTSQRSFSKYAMSRMYG